MARQKTVEEHLPAKAPKKTRKRGVGPVADAMEEANKILEADVVEVVEEDIEGADEQEYCLRCRRARCRGQ